ncbi:arp2/3 complex-activating protein rickA [Patella vulgata]|uniref:arp2/3 complex-activating protein rickA n=1 Tax=Patella vulgata TaxID=6465 RepID=UPI0024A91951|nr:arp2/3 complex-activating protein rickA [Patella vulgata]
MCQCTTCTHAMFEGKNIHYSSVDNKPLCSFSTKVCNQRRLNGYAFCVRHILEDFTAPFKRCGYVAKSSNQMCTQPIPKNEERIYCNNHMQVLGMLPKKERKPKKEKDNKNANKDSKLSFGDRVKTKFNVKKSVGVTKPKTENISVNIDDPYDPYAFSDPVAETPCMLSNSSSSSLPSPNTEIKSVPPSPGYVPPKTPSNEGTSTIAKLYPELAEKLEKIKPKTVEPKVKSRMRNSHNMKFNKLQTKIAQNRIKDKLRKSQENSHFNEGLQTLQARSNLESVTSSTVINNSNTNNNINYSDEQVRFPMVPPPYNGSVIPPPLVGASPHLLGYKTTDHPNIQQIPQEPHGLPPPYPRVACGQPYGVPRTSNVVVHSNDQHPVIAAPALTPAPVVPCAAAPYNLPPPPPYIPPKPPKRPPSPVLPVLCEKPQRLKCLLLEKEAKRRLKRDSSVKYYSFHARRKISNHILINQGICSSDEESEDEDVDMLPWQPNWFCPSSDDDNNDEDEPDEDFSDLRTTKLALLRSRLRRQCHQCRTATRGNTTVKKSSNLEVLALIKAAKEEPRASVRCIQEILRKPRKAIDK